MTESYQANNRRIAKNTLFLYVRMVFALLVTLYTSRVLLDVLGVEDFGLYNVVGGVVAMLGFFNGAMVSSTLRFFSFAIGQGDTDQLRQNYSAILLIQTGLALLVILLAETVGLWFVHNYLVIPPGRFDAALWVYHLAVLSFAVTMLQVPFTALIITHERMDAYALISIGNVLLRLGLVFSLPYLPYDKLKSFALLTFAVTLLTAAGYYLYCRIRIGYVRPTRHVDRGLYRVLLSYMGWNLWGNSAAVMMAQGINVLLNLFFGPAVNAARSISYQVLGGLNQLSVNLQLALNPSIVKSYAKGEIEYMHQLIIYGSKLSFFLILIFALPIGLECQLVLGIWLKEVPPHTVAFTNLILVMACIDSLSEGLLTGVQASGRVKRFRLCEGPFLMLNLPISYLLLKGGSSAESTMVVQVIIAAAALFVRLALVSPLIQLSKVRFLRDVVLPAVTVTLISLAVGLGIRHLIPYSGFWSGLVVMILGFACCLLLIGLVGLSPRERSMVLRKLISYKK